MIYELTLLATALAFFMMGYFCLSIIYKRNDIADEAWGLGFVLLCIGALALGGTSLVGIIITICVTIWGIRLFTHIHHRHKGKGEDARYAVWRSQWKHFLVRSFFQVFALQGVLLFMVALPAVATVLYGGSITVLTIFGIGIWMFGFVFEVNADRQLARFISKEQNKGKLMTTGLWRYSRHPNYFGEVTLWWGIYLCALSVGAHPLVIIGPITITILILFVSGIPMAEKRYRGREDFESYARRTSPFIPLPTKQEADASLS